MLTHKAELTDIKDDQIHLWCCCPSQVTDAALAEQYHTLLNDDERRRYHRFHFEKDRHRHLVTRALIRSTLSHYHPEKTPSEWTFEHNRFGKPSLSSHTKSPIAFNISHSHDLIVVAVTSGRKIGADIEWIKEKSRIDGLAEHCFTSEEQNYIYAGKNNQLLERFFQLWTLKESYIKAYGNGLSIPLKDLTFSIEQKKISLALTGKHTDNTLDWQFYSDQLKGNYQLAVCVEQPVGDLRDKIVFIDAIPMRDYRVLHPKN